ncbi:MAG: type II toxin-antitoxin system RelE/ParE family toxin [Methanomicrobia archaeon]|nr:type II toxin-antitoxin system RelE/ParE family toxin [Methanomicrobia archaeon]MCK4637219.1 type II toxin-antitoxin system RelE/ParE family toxin [Methanomicrobia archaeon]
MSEWIIKAHSLFLKDLEKLNKEHVKRTAKIILEIKENPRRFKALKGFKNHFRVRFDKYRLIYCLRDNEIHLVILEERKKVYKELKKRK